MSPSSRNKFLRGSTSGVGDVTTGQVRVGWAALALSCLLLQGAAHAANVTITGTDPRQNITVTIEDATVDFVLKDLHKKFGFELADLPPNIPGGKPKRSRCQATCKSFSSASCVTGTT